MVGLGERWWRESVEGWELLSWLMRKASVMKEY